MHLLSLGNRASVPVPVRMNLEAVRNAQEELTKESFLKTQSPDNFVVSYHAQKYFEELEREVAPLGIGTSITTTFFLLITPEYAAFVQVIATILCLYMIWQLYIRGEKYREIKDLLLLNYAGLEGYWLVMKKTPFFLFSYCYLAMIASDQIGHFELLKIIL